MSEEQRRTAVMRAMRAAEGAAARGLWEEARQGYEFVLNAEPAFLPAHLQLSTVLLQLDRYCDAYGQALKATAFAPDHPAVLLEIARHLERFNEYGRLLDLLPRSSFGDRADAGMLTEMARIVSSGSGEQELALDLIGRALQLEPDHPRALYTKGAILMFLGRPQEAESAFEATIALAPDFAQAHWMLSLVRKWMPGAAHVERLGAALGRADDASARAYLGFALHNELHDLGDFDRAWAALDAACEIKAAQERYDDAAADRLFSSVKRLCDTEFVKPILCAEPFVPLFIVGMHRSGTTLLERILGGHSAIADGGESYAFTEQLRRATDHGIAGALDPVAVARLPVADFSEIGRGYFSRSTWRTKGKPFLTEKLPGNLLNVGFIAKALPNARFLHMVRDPMDTCFSNLRTFFAKAAPYSYNQETLARHYLRYMALMDHWRQVLPGRVLDVRYDRLVNEPEATAREIFAFCGLAFEPGALEVQRSTGSVSTASVAHARQGILRNRHSQWWPYREYLRPLQQALEAGGALAATPADAG